MKIVVDEEMLGHPAVFTLSGKYEVVPLPLGAGVDLILSSRASYFDPAWWSDPKLVEAALKRARAAKRKAKK